MAKTNSEAAVAQAEGAAYTKEQLLGSAKYANRRDLIRTLLDDGKTYTLDKVDGLIGNFMKGKVT